MKRVCRQLVAVDAGVMYAKRLLSSESQKHVLGHAAAGAMDAR